ncbi:AlpA family phage regulatory protein [Gammaproteobacteria bacterium]|nr:AlpA family phage regulatory protein [Gammaproteobacteria bacterium]
MTNLLDRGYVRLPQIIGNRKAEPPISPIIPVSKSTWWAGVRSGRFPKSYKLGPRTTAWRVSDILELIERTNREAVTDENEGGEPRGNENGQ